MSDIREFIETALEASIYIEPTAPGLTTLELVEVGKRLGHLPGEIDDALSRLGLVTERGRWMLSRAHSIFLTDFYDSVDPDYRKPEVFEYVTEKLRYLAREQGERWAMIDRSVLIAQGEADGHKRHDIEVTIDVLKRCDRLTETDNIVRPTSVLIAYALPSEQIRQRRHAGTTQRPLLRQLYLLVKDVAARRTDGRPAAANPIDAFESMLDALERPQFKIWWRQLASEVQRLQPELAPTAVTVLCAAMCEGALLLIVKRAQELSATLNSKGLRSDPTHQWKFEDLAKAACMQPDPVFDDRTKDRCMELNAIRQRIHAGRLISEPTSVPSFDARPEEARYAKETLELVSRKVVVWVQGHPKSAPT